jgi:3-hydroxyacyl-CoA dehydrogenase/enoyl-CoA hydratase/3-hydroxybutyryl-CoA epimerase/enoyl-CoA isomerase
MFAGQSIQLKALEHGLVELCFDRQDDTINKLDNRTVAELGEAAAAIARDSGVRGVLITSAKEVFIVGADILEFGKLFQLPERELSEHNAKQNRSFTAIEELPVPSVVAINGFALGGGLEAALAADFRVMSTQAQIGLPEVKLGLFPGFGGTVRLPRVAGLRTTLEWIVSGAPAKAESALQAGAVDEIATPESLRDAALVLLNKAVAGEADWRTRRESKRSAVPAASAEQLFAAATEKAAKGPKHQPAALMAIELLKTSFAKPRDEALALESAGFARVSKTQAAGSLVRVFLNEQAVKKQAKALARAAKPVKKAAVLGAGIMGGGIAYTAAFKSVPVVLKDIQQKQLDLGIGEARKQLSKQVKSGRITQPRVDEVLASIQPVLDYAGFGEVDIAIEAVVENLKVKHAVLGELERELGAEAVIASNTSSLRIDDLAQPLARPENFAGMHFFNPVPSMPLVEVIRGARTSETTLAKVVGLAVTMGKTPIVVRDGAGFLVNRIITPYMQAFGKLLADGEDFVRIDAVMEAFGWPMGPAYLNDVIGMDTALHVARIISGAFPAHMARSWDDPLEILVAQGRLGQKNGLGFYRYEADPNGRPKKSPAPEAHELLAKVQKNGPQTFTDEQIVERMMLPLIFEAARCLQEGVVASAAELDMALLLGIGLPAYLGGALQYADWLGARHLVELSHRYRDLGPQYEAPANVRRMAEQQQRFYQEA